MQPFARETGVRTPNRNCMDTTQMGPLSYDIRALGKWLNEEITAPIDRPALARVLHAIQATQEPAQAGELPDEHIPSIGCGFWIDKISVSNLRHIHRSESATAMISALINATDAIEDAQALIATLRSALSARKPLTPDERRALTDSRDIAMRNAAAARIPECGDFAAIAQDLDWLCDQFGIDLEVKQ